MKSEHAEREKRNQELVLNKLQSLSVKTALLLETCPYYGNGKFHYYCGYFCLKSLKKFGNSVLSEALVDLEGVEATEKAIKKLIGVPVEIRYMEKESEKFERAAYAVHLKGSRSDVFLPKPKVFSMKESFK